MKKIWILLLGIFVAYIAIADFFDTHEYNFFSIQINNWIFRWIGIASAFGCFWEYYKVNWGKTKFN